MSPTRNRKQNLAEILAEAEAEGFRTPSKIHAYDTRTDQLLWEVKGQSPGMELVMWANEVTTDGRGHLYVCDKSTYTGSFHGNACIQMFSVSDGEYLGALINKGKQKFGDPWRVRWSENLESLIVVHFKNAYYISAVNVKMP